MDLLLNLLAILIIVGAGLIAGVFLAFSSFVMRALARVRPANGAEAMQQINVTVINPVFLGTFMGAAALGSSNGFNTINHSAGKERKARQPAKAVQIASDGAGAPQHP